MSRRSSFAVSGLAALAAAVVVAAWRIGEGGSGAAAVAGSPLERAAPLALESRTQSIGDARAADAQKGPENEGLRGRDAAGSPEANALAEIEGVMCFSDGRPAAGLPVHVAQHRASDERVLYEEKAEADAEGHFRLPVLGEGLCTVSADVHALSAGWASGQPTRKRAWRHMALAENVAPGTRGLRLVLQPGDLLAGRVVDDEGAPVRSFSVRARPVRAIPGPLGKSVQGRFRGDDGRFVLDGLLPGEWEIDAQPHALAGSRKRRIFVPSGEELVLQVDRCARVAGLVLLPDGRPAAGVRVEAERGCGELAPGRLTDAGGRFDDFELPPGRQRLIARTWGFAASVAQEVVLAPGEARDDLIFALRRPASIAVERRADPSGSVGNIELRGPGDLRRLWTDPRGPVEFSSLEPGVYTLSLVGESVSGSVQLEGGKAMPSSPQPRAVERLVLAEGENRTVVLTPPVAQGN